MTDTGQWEMRIDIQNADQSWTYLQYNSFKVGPASQGYPLIIGGTDYFANLNGRKFSTKDVENDAAYRIHCAAIQQAGWWFYSTCNIMTINRQPPILYPNTVLFTEN